MERLNWVLEILKFEERFKSQPFAITLAYRIGKIVVRFAISERLKVHEYGSVCTSMVYVYAVRFVKYVSCCQTIPICA